MIVAVGAWRGYEWWQTKQAAEAGAAFEQAVTLAESGKHQEAEAAFAKLATDGTAGYRVLARLREAAELAGPTARPRSTPMTRSPPTKAPAQVMQDLAALRAGFLLVDSASYGEMRARLEPLTGAGSGLPAQRARIAGAVRLEGRRHERGAAMDRHDHGRPADAGRRARSRAEVLSELIAASGKG